MRMSVSFPVDELVCPDLQQSLGTFILYVLRVLISPSILDALYNYHHQSYQVPDYTAYDQVLSAFKRLVPVPTA
jgi:hypothetical protein